MWHVYQPMMIKVVLERGGEATIEEIAEYLLAYNQSHVEYYSLRMKTMGGRIFIKNGVVEQVKDGRKITGQRLTAGTLTEGQRTASEAMCGEAAIDALHKEAWGCRMGL